MLASDLGLSPHTITDIVDGLERAGMAERRPDPTDRRAKLVAITDAGEAGLDVANATRDRLLTQVFGALSEADRETLLRLLDRLDEAARELITTSSTSHVSLRGYSSSCHPSLLPRLRSSPRRTITGG